MVWRAPPPALLSLAAMGCQDLLDPVAAGQLALLQLLTLHLFLGGEIDALVHLIQGLFKLQMLGPEAGLLLVLVHKRPDQFHIC